MNSGGFREVPDAHYPQDAPNDWFYFQHSLAVSNPGPYLYTIHNRPDLIHGYRRLQDGRLELLSGFPYNIPVGPNNFRTAPIWLEGHPFLPVFYSSNAVNNGIGSFKINSDGSLTSLGFLDLGQIPDGLAPQAMAITPDGSALFVSCYDGDQILSIKVDTEDGTLGEPQLAALLPDHGRGLALTDDGQFLYATTVGGDSVLGFQVVGSELIPLDPASVHLPTDGLWLWTQGSFLAVGGLTAKKIVIFQIQQDGSLNFAPGSPMRISNGFHLIYAAFDNSSSQLFFGSAWRRAFHIDQHGQLLEFEDSPLRGGGEVHYGISVSPEPVGDPYSLTFAQTPGPQDQSIIIQGDPFTPFSLEINGECIPGLLTNDEGWAEIPAGTLIDSTVELKVYCQDEEILARVQTVPALSHVGQAILFMTLVLAAFWVSKYQK